MAQSGVVDASELIDRCGLGPLQIRVLILCALVYLLDGYDTLSIGLTAPSLASATQSPLNSFGTVFSTGILGTMLGTFSFGLIGDQIGRKWSLIVACLLFALFSLMTMTITSFSELLAVRFLTSVGLGGATPLFVAMATEYSPQRLRGLAMSVVYAAFPLGGAAAGVISWGLIPSFGWKVIFLIGGTVPLAICVLLVFGLPESIRFLVSRGDRQDEVRRLLGRIGAVEFAPGTQFISESAHAGKRASLRKLFADLPLGQSLLLWLMFFAMFMVIMTLSMWTPALLRNSGFSLRAASLISAANFFGGVLGTIGSGYVFDRFGAGLALLPQFLLSAILLASCCLVSGSPVLLGIVIMLIGVFVSGATTGLLALAGSLYSTPVRSTGIGTALGVGRIGQALGPLGIGVLVGHHMGISSIFLVAAFPCLVATMAIMFGPGIQSSRSRTSAHAETPPRIAVSTSETS